MKIILHTTDDIEGAAHAASQALKYAKDHPEWKPDILGLRTSYNDKLYGIKWNKNSISVYPN